MLKRILQTPLYLQVLFALIAAAIVGGFVQAASHHELLSDDSVKKIKACFDFVGTMFLRALKMLIVPLIMSAVITSMSGLGKDKAFGRMGLKTLAYYMTTSFLAITTGLLLVNIIQPGLVDESTASELMEKAATAEEVTAKVGEPQAGDVIGIFHRMIPTNIIRAAADGQMLGLIIFSLLMGYFITQIKHELEQSIGHFWQAVYEVMLKITDLVMRFTPIGVFGLVGQVAIETGPEEVIALFKFFITVVLALGVHAFIIMPLLLFFIARINPINHYRAMFSALLTAFSTASSSATLPITMDCLQKKAGVSRRVTSFTTPLGATVNMDGTALYECVAVIFLIQFYGQDLSFTVQLTTVILALLTSIGVAGIPSASLVAIVIILGAVGMPPESIGLLMIFDRILDMCRTSVNVLSDSCGAVIIARSEGETTNLSNTS
ncbi:MAG: dicarboxylate/amino acid:cation symporter [Verrucomicrobiota bacterium]